MTLSQRALLRIREEMQARDLTQHDLAARLRCSQSRIAKILNEGVKLRVEDLALLASAVDVPVAEAVPGSRAGVLRRNDAERSPGGTTPSQPTLPPAPRPPAATIVLDRSDLEVTREPDNSFRFRGSVINSGPDCATALSGQTRLMFGATVLTYAWALPPSQIIRVNERVSYEGCCIPAGTPDGTFSTTFTSTPILCP